MSNTKLNNVDNLEDMKNSLDKAVTLILAE
jgi:hypothetical protein